MNILLLTTLYPEPERPDLVADTNSIHYFTKEWIKLGHNVVVIHTYIHPFKKIFSRKNKTVTISDLDGVKILLFENKVLFPKYNNLSPFQKRRLSRKIIFFLKTELNNMEIDVAICHFPKVEQKIIFGLELSCPKIAVLHNFDLQLSSKELSKLEEKFDKVLFRSSSLKKDFINKTGKISNGDIIYSGIPSKYIKKRKYTNCSDDIKIIFAGKITKNKNLEIILSALSMINLDINIEMKIIGDGPNLVKIIKRTNELKLTGKVLFLGKLSRDEVLLEMENSDIFIMVSKTETFGLVYLEAMSKGLIVVATRGQGIDGIIKDKVNGFLCSSNSPEELKSIINYIINLKPLELENIRQNAINTVSKLTEYHAAINYLNAINKVIDQFGSKNI